MGLEGGRRANCRRYARGYMGARTRIVELEAALSILRERGVPFQQLGQVGGNELSIRVDEETFRWPIVDLHDDWWNAIRGAVESASADRLPSL